LDRAVLVRGQDRIMQFNDVGAGVAVDFRCLIRQVPGAIKGDDDFFGMTISLQ
jgi:hypothetical protein